jgi:hypothetical protein
MKWSIAAITLLLVGAIGSFALAQKDTGRPVGVPASQWIPLSDRAGIVISDYQPGDEDKTSQGLIPTVPVQSLRSRGGPTAPAQQRAAQLAAAAAQEHSLGKSAGGNPIYFRGYVNGYFMVKQDGRWTRLSVVPPPELLGAIRPN